MIYSTVCYHWASIDHGVKKHSCELPPITPTTSLISRRVQVTWLSLLISCLNPKPLLVWTFPQVCWKLPKNACLKIKPALALLLHFRKEMLKDWNFLTTPL